MRRQMNNIISVVCSAIRIILYKITNKNFHANIIERFSPNVVLEFNRSSKVVLGKKIRIHSGSKIKARSGAELIIGDNVKINYNCIIICHKKISIGYGSEFGPSVYIYDHDHDYKVGLNKEKFILEPVTIGKNCWIGANTILLKGSNIGDNCVIAAGSIVKGNIPSNSLYIQKRESKLKKIN